MSGRMDIDFGHVLILTSNHVRSIVKHAQDMENMSQRSANAIRTTTVRDVNIGMSAQLIKTVVYRENVLTLLGLHCHANSAIANLAGLDQDAVKVRSRSTSYFVLTNRISLSPQNLTLIIIFVSQIFSHHFLISRSPESSIKSTDIDFSLYTTKTLTPDFKIHWRILKEQKEIEMALVVNGTSWVGFGWRPRSLTAECRKFPLIQEFGASSEPSSEPSPETTAKPEPESQAETSPEPESTAEHHSTPETSSEPKSEPESTSEVTAEPESTSEPKSEPEAIAEPKRGGKALEPLALGSYKSSRISALPGSKQSDQDEYTVSTSVSYRISSVAGRKKRAAQKGNFQ